MKKSVQPKLAVVAPGIYEDHFGRRVKPSPKLGTYIDEKGRVFVYETWLDMAAEPFVMHVYLGKPPKWKPPFEAEMSPDELETAQEVIETALQMEGFERIRISR